MTRIRDILTVRRREHVPPGAPPHYIAHRRGDEWGVAVLHGGREIHWYTAREARRAANRLLDAAYLAANPSSLPQEDHG